MDIDATLGEDDIRGPISARLKDCELENLKIKYLGQTWNANQVAEVQLLQQFEAAILRKGRT